ncbi:MAG: hypothetical protein DMG06_06350 [Acidobacteria bacterium]|nr:MAG: hypothetical protein DMG06_06350 [Acidobacteriota bacterium]
MLDKSPSPIALFVAGRFVRIAWHNWRKATHVLNADLERRDRVRPQTLRIFALQAQLSGWG